MLYHEQVYTTLKSLCYVLMAHYCYYYYCYYYCYYYSYHHDWYSSFVFVVNFVIEIPVVGSLVEIESLVVVAALIPETGFVVVNLHHVYTNNYHLFYSQ